MSARKLLRAAVQQTSPGAHGADVAVSEILANIDAMAHVVSESKKDQDISVATLRKLHRKLMPKTLTGNDDSFVRTSQK